MDREQRDDRKRSHTGDRDVPRTKSRRDDDNSPSSSDRRNGGSRSRVRDGAQTDSPNDDRVPRAGSSVNVQSRLRDMAAISTVDLTDDTQEPPRRPGDGPGGRRARRPRPTDAQRADFVHTKPDHVTAETKKAATNNPAVQKQGRQLSLVANFYPVDARSQWTIYHYHVDFEPEIERTNEKRALFRVHARKFPGWLIFEGASLYVSRVVPDDLLELYSDRGQGGGTVSLKINPQYSIVTGNDPVNIQIYNCVVRLCMRELRLREMGRHYYDDQLKITKAQHRLEIWPGYKTSLRQHERSLMLCVEMTNKVLRMDNVYEYMTQKNFDEHEIGNELIGSIVMTYYNKRTYRIDDIKWDEDPVSKTFDRQGTIVSLKDYMTDKYPDLKLRHERQPILYSKPKKNEVRRGMSEMIALIPEFCHMTGLSDGMRRNFNLMRELNVHLQLNPDDRVRSIEKFRRRLDDSRERILEPAGLQFSNQLVELQGRQLNPETIFFGSKTQNVPDLQRYEWTNPLQGSAMFETVPLRKWVVLATQFDGNVNSFIHLIVEKAKRMDFRIDGNPQQISVQRTNNPGQQVRGFLAAIDEVMSGHGADIQMIMVILPNNNESLYGEIKRKCYLEYGKPSQCVQNRHMTVNSAKKAQQSGVACKLAIQMNAKLGGIPWSVAIPPNAKNAHGVMIVGFNISQTGRTKSSNVGRTTGALVASLNATITKYFSVIVEQERGQLLSTLLGVKMTLALHSYRRKNNGSLPEKIIFYRDGVGEGQLQSVFDTEVTQIEKSFEEIYTSSGVQPPKFAFIVVNKRINTKFFERQRGQYANPPPGTCVDDVVTLPERYDFFIMSQKGTGQGTVSPTSYNVIHDTIRWQCHHIQLLTYKLCHLYFNWSSTLAVPAPCQYAHKLAFLQNVMNKAGRRDEQVADPKPQLAETLYYL